MERFLLQNVSAKERLETLEVETFAQVNGREISFVLISPAANQTMEELRDKSIDTEITEIRDITPDIVIIEV